MAAVTLLVSNASTIVVILAAMAVVALIETVVPLHARRGWYEAHAGPNLALTFVTFAISLVFNIALVATLGVLQTIQFGLLHLVSLPSLVTAAVAVVLLDFSFYVAHRAMHRSAPFWRFHLVHHCDPAVDVTTTIRQHPGETVIRYAFMSAFAVVVGPTPAAFARSEEH